MEWNPKWRQSTRELEGISWRYWRTFWRTLSIHFTAAEVNTTPRQETWHVELFVNDKRQRKVEGLDEKGKCKGRSNVIVHRNGKGITLLYLFIDKLSIG